MLRGYQATVLHHIHALYFCSNSIVSIASVGFNNVNYCCQSEGMGNQFHLKNAFQKYFGS